MLRGGPHDTWEGGIVFPRAKHTAAPYVSSGGPLMKILFHFITLVDRTVKLTPIVTGYIVHSERRGRIAIPHRHCVGANLTGAVTVTGGGGAFQTYTKERTLPIRIWPITDAVSTCSLADSDVVDHGAD